jgi:predicted phosphoadenosine phosphosulfate sulfurtransferase
MVNRVPGAAAAARYCQDELYGRDVQLPPGLTWREWTFRQLELYPEPYKSVIAGNVAALLAQHKSKTKRPVNEEEPDGLSGLSWKFLAILVNRGDMKNRRKDIVTMGSILYRDKSALEEMLNEKDLGTRY